MKIQLFLERALSLNFDKQHELGTSYSSKKPGCLIAPHWILKCSILQDKIIWQFCIKKKKKN